MPPHFKSPSYLVLSQTHTISKAAIDDKIGITFAAAKEPWSGDDNAVSVDTVVPGSLAGRAGVRVKSFVLSINGKAFTSAQAAIDELKGAVGDITIVTKCWPPSALCLVPADSPDKCIFKEAEKLRAGEKAELTFGGVHEGFGVTFFKNGLNGRVDTSCCVAWQFASSWIQAVDWVHIDPDLKTVVNAEHELVGLTEEQKEWYTLVGRKWYLDSNRLEAKPVVSVQSTGDGHLQVIKPNGDPFGDGFYGLVMDVEMGHLQAGQTVNFAGGGVTPPCNMCFGDKANTFSPWPSKQWTVNDDGTISPRSKPELVLGLGVRPKPKVVGGAPWGAHESVRRIAPGAETMAR